MAELLDAVLANSPEAIVIVDDLGHIVYASDGASLLLGYDAHSVEGRPVFDFVHPADADAAALLFIRRIEYAGADLGHDIRLRHARGGDVEVRVTLSMLPPDSAGAFAITLQPADGPNTERALRRRLVVEEFAKDLSADLLEASGQAEVLDRFERSLSELGLLTGADVVTVFLEQHRGSAIERLVQWVEPRFERFDGPSEIEPASAPEGIERMLSYSVHSDDLRKSPIPGLENLPRTMGVFSLLSVPFYFGDQRGFLALLRLQEGPAWSDADAHLARVIAKLFGRALDTARSDELLTRTYREGPLGFSIRTWDGRLVDCNQQYLDMYGLTREEAEQIEPRELVAPEDRERAEASLRSLQAGDTERSSEVLRILRPDGRPLVIRVQTVRLETTGSTEQLVLNSIEDVTEHHARQLELERAVTSDALTGVANRVAMRRVVELAERNGVDLPSLFIIDLDRFTLVNDSMGHLAGDKVLQGVVDRLRRELRDHDLLARLGGDEFAVVVPDITFEGATQLADRLRRSLERPIEIDGRAVPQTVSIGVALGPECPTSGELFVRADRAVHAAKAKGRNRAVVFDEFLSDHVVQELDLERDLRHAIDHDELAVFFQPEFATADLGIIGAEALLRWCHPERGILPAGSFIETLERSGMIDDIGRFALRTACASFQRIRESTGRDDLGLRVNISGREFGRPELPDLVRAALAESGLPSDRLCLEMTEMTLMDAPDVALRTFARLRQIGVQFAIDDFGTGYSSLTYLKRFPVDALKVDRSFVDDIATDTDSLAIVESVMGLAGAMGLDVVAEGIETEEQLAILRELGCERAQGYLVSQPVPAADFARMLEPGDERAIRST